MAKGLGDAGSPSEPPDAKDAGIEFGWQVHQAVQAWTASVDTKASIVVVVETAVAGAGTHALIAGSGELHHAVGLHLTCAITSVVALIAAVVCALWVVFPRLERARTQRLAPSGLIYFGHLRERSVDDLEQALTGLTPEAERRQLASQLQITGAVAWRKHAWLQRSLVCFALGSALLVLAYTAF